LNVYITGYGQMAILPCPLRRFSQFRQAAGTALMVETYGYSYGSVQVPPPANVADYLNAIPVRHGGMSNVLFMDGHVESRYARQMPIYLGYPLASREAMVNTIFTRGAIDPKCISLGNF
jgi:prepilin-type processing-associated H-X9-DG protein